MVEGIFQVVQEAAAPAAIREAPVPVDELGAWLGYVFTIETSGNWRDARWAAEKSN